MWKPSATVVIKPARPRLYFTDIWFLLSPFIISETEQCGPVLLVQVKLSLVEATLG